MCFVASLPVILFFVAIVSVISLGRRVCSECTSTFLLVLRTPPFWCGFALQAVSICLGGWLVGPLKILPREVIVGVLKNIFLIFSFVILSLMTCPIPIQRILQMLLCQKTSSLVMWEQQSAHGSQPHRSWLAGIARKISCFALKLV